MLARKPLTGTVARNVEAHGTGALNIDATRIPANGKTPFPVGDHGERGLYGVDGERTDDPNPSGRWPANVCLDPEAAAMLDAQTGDLHAQDPATHGSGSPRSGIIGFADGGSRHYGDTGGASRFFLTVPPDTLCVLCDAPCAKPAGSSSPPGEHPTDIALGPAQDAVRHGNADKSAALPSPAPSAAVNGATTRETGGATAPPTAPGPLADWIVQLAKSAAHLCDSCATATAQSIVLTLRDPIPATERGAGSTSERKPRTLGRNLALVAEGARSTGIIPTTESLRALCGSAAAATTENTTASGTADAGDRMRLRYTPKASRREREAGLSGGGEVVEGGRRNVHPLEPTVKPVALMRWLVRLVTPPGGIVLDPFAGSGSTGIAALLEGMEFVGVEREAEYAEIARQRIGHAESHPHDYDPDEPEPVEAAEGQLSIEGAA